MRVYTATAVTTAATVALAAPLRRSNPTLASYDVVGIVNQATYDRDSCGSVLFDSRVLWVCRDTEVFDSSWNLQAFYSSTASWTDFNSSNLPDWQPAPADSGYDYPYQLTAYGDNSGTYYPLNADECNTDGSGGGGCSDGSRFAIWPDSPPLITSNDNGVITAYTWIKIEHISSSLSFVELDGPTSLYKVTYDPSVEGTGSTLPAVEFVQEYFFPQGTFPYGSQGNLIQDGVAYLYGQSDEGAMGLAKVSVDSIEDASAYQYWYNGDWTDTAPNVNDTLGQIDATAGGQGTFYWSPYFNEYVWLGQAYQSVYPTFYISTAPNAWGPWSTSTELFTGENGNYTLGAYSFQAAPGMLPGGDTQQLYITYTKNDVNAEGVTLYATLAYLLEFN